MSATDNPTRNVATGPGATDGAAVQADGPDLPAASLPEALGVLLSGVVPAIARGLFSPRRNVTRLLTAVDSDHRAVSTLRAVRRKRGGEGVRLLGGRVVVLWGTAAIKEVLDHSAYAYASDGGAKAKGMSHFQPDALTLSRGEEWEDRRAFTEAVLATPERVHPLAERFLSVIGDEVERLRLETLDSERWQRLFDHITLRVIFGEWARGDQGLTDALEQLMSEANRLVGLKPNDTYYELYGQLDGYLRDPEPGSLISRFADAPHSDRTRIAQQIPHWIFAMRDTLGTNCYRALAAIVADPQVKSRVDEELAQADLSRPADVDGLRYLEGCLQEAMRLWPTTPLLARETTGKTTLAGEQLDEGTQVIMLNVFNHRDPDHVEDPDRLVPERWADGGRDYRFNHLSNGTQDCPGGPLVLLLGKAILARMLTEYRLELVEPELDSARLPHMLDVFQIRLSAEPRPRT